MVRLRAVVLGILSLAVAATVTGQQPPLPPSAADVNRDGLVDAADAAIVQANFGRRCGQAGLDARADVNGDCLVNVVDLAFVSKNLGQKFPPTIVASVSPAANQNGWQNAPVTVSFTCTGTSACPASVTITSEGANQTIDRTASNA